MPDPVIRRVVAAFAAGAVMLLIAVAVAFAAPLAALGLAAGNSLPVVAILRTVPEPYRSWF